MCVVSMVMDHYNKTWPRRLEPYGPAPYQPPTPAISPQEIQEFRELLERAREYDRKNNEPDCEMGEKKQKLLDLAKELGVEIDFL